MISEYNKIIDTLNKKTYEKTYRDTVKENDHYSKLNQDIETALTYITSLNDLQKILDKYDEKSITYINELRKSIKENLNGIIVVLKDIKNDTKDKNLEDSLNNFILISYNLLDYFDNKNADFNLSTSVQFKNKSKYYSDLYNQLSTDKSKIVEAIDFEESVYSVDDGIRIQNGNQEGQIVLN